VKLSLGLTFVRNYGSPTSEDQPLRLRLDAEQIIQIWMTPGLEPHWPRPAPNGGYLKSPVHNAW
jgi:hypothetical protein